jgi:hypothetical protein
MSRAPLASTGWPNAIAAGRLEMSTDRANHAPGWLEPLCRIALPYRTGDASIRELFDRAAEC